MLKDLIPTNKYYVYMYIYEYICIYINIYINTHIKWIVTIQDGNTKGLVDNEFIVDNLFQTGILYIYMFVYIYI